MHDLPRTPYPERAHAPDTIHPLHGCTVLATILPLTIRPARPRVSASGDPPPILLAVAVSDHRSIPRPQEFHRSRHAPEHLAARAFDAVEMRAWT